jgi:hypothetical protein
VARLRSPAVPLSILSAAFVAAGGFVHLRDWLETYRHVPASAPGSEVVRIGFLISAGVSAALAVGLAGVVFAGRRLAGLVIASAALFQVVSLGTLIQTRRGSVLGWMERGWSVGATQARAVEIGALVALTALATVMLLAQRQRSLQLAALRIDHSTRRPPSRPSGPGLDD